MIYLKSILVGLAAAVAVVVVYVVALFAYFMLSFAATWGSGAGSGGIGAVVGSGPVVIVPLVAFVVGFYWKFRSEKRAEARL